MPPGTSRPPWRSRGRRRAAAVAVGLTCFGGTAAVAVASGLFDDPFGTAKVGQQIGNRILLPTNQWISPIGDRALVDNGRITSSTLSPDGHRLAAQTWNHNRIFLTIMDPGSGQIVQQVARPVDPGNNSSADPVLGDGTVSPDGPLYSADGRTLWMPQSTDILKFAVNGDGSVVPTPTVIKIAGTHPAPNNDAIPSGMALSADGTKLYVALNGNNTLGVIDANTNQLLTQIPVGNAPRQVRIRGGEAFVSDEGGRPAASGENTNNSYGTDIVSDPSTGGATTGTVSVVDLAGQKETQKIPVGLQPTALYLRGKQLLVANSNDDSVSIIDTDAKRVEQTFNVNPIARVGSYPNAITMTDDHHILVSIGRDNAIGVFGIDNPKIPVRMLGLLPTDWYPVGVEVDQAIGKIVVTNDKGIGARGPESTITYENKATGYVDVPPATGHNTYNDTGSVTTFAPPSQRALGRYTHEVFANNAWRHLGGRIEARGDGRSSGREGLGRSPVPAQLGDPSPIKHVFLIVKENRTYDQVLGDLGRGDSDPSLAQFGWRVTPNQHVLANRFGVFDNFYDEGTLSADGHNWLMQADTNDYVEKEFGAFTRSYPAEGGDALAYQRDGFIWNAAARAGRSTADFGEYAHFWSAPAPPAGPTWSQWYQDSQVLEGKAPGPLPVPLDRYHTYPDNIGSLPPILCPWYPEYNLNVPDQYRVDIWERAFLRTGGLPDSQCQDKQYPGGRLAALTLLRVPDDHTAGVTPGEPYPSAMVADNDLATGRIIADISHSRYWKSSAIFVVEDDPQNGVDHIDGHRSTALVVSPWVRRGAVNHRYYTQLNMVRTIEQILGIQPMNQEDRAAMPMFDAFTNRPDFRPVDVVPNRIPLDAGVSAAGPASPTASTAAVRVPRSIRAIYRQWVAWSLKQRFTSPEEADLANPAQLNRADWYSATGWRRPYPGDRRILAPNQVPGRNRPAAEIG